MSVVATSHMSFLYSFMCKHLSCFSLLIFKMSPHFPLWFKDNFAILTAVALASTLLHHLYQFDHIGKRKAQGVLGFTIIHHYPKECSLLLAICHGTLAILMHLLYKSNKIDIVVSCCVWSISGSYQQLSSVISSLWVASIRSSFSSCSFQR